MDKSQEENNLLALIYETAHDPGFWPLLLEGLNKEFDTLHNQAPNGPDSGLVPKNGALNIFSGDTTGRTEINTRTTVADTLLPPYRYSEFDVVGD